MRRTGGVGRGGAAPCPFLFFLGARRESRGGRARAPADWRGVRARPTKKGKLKDTGQAEWHKPRHKLFDALLTKPPQALQSFAKPC